MGNLSPILDPENSDHSRAGFHGGRAGFGQIKTGIPAGDKAKLGVFGLVGLMPYRVTIWRQQVLTVHTSPLRIPSGFLGDLWRCVGITCH